MRAAGPLETDERASGIAAAIRHLAAADPVLAGLLDHYGAPDLKPDGRLFRTLVRAIVSQQLSGAGAAAIMRRVEALFPEGDVHAAGLAALSDEPLRAAGLSRAKTAALHDLATHVLDGRLDLVGMDSLSDDEVVAQLVAVRGIGRWTAEMFLIFSLGRLDVLPVDDYGVRSAIKRAYALPDLPNKKAMVELAAPWHPYCSVASLLLWRSLENRPVR